ncbi:MAG: dethiobiotin synthase [Deltaproteobacteria bacterium]|nr:dethiobiotin synthase [Deltaproteobacteria bacterium]
MVAPTDTASRLTGILYSATILSMTGKGLFITGTDTGVGKTFVTSLIVKALKEKGIDVGVMKPVETGCRIKNGILKPSDALFLKKIADIDDNLDIINPYRFKEPVTPSAAARKNNRQIKLSKIRDCYKKLASRHDFIVVEGAGGLLVPLNSKETIADLIKLLKLPVIIVAASRLGAINHTLLTVRCAKQLGIKIHGIIFNNITEQKKSSPRLKPSGTGLMNMEEVKRFTDAPIIGEIPFAKRHL